MTEQTTKADPLRRGTAAWPGAHVVQALPSGIHAGNDSIGYGSPGAARAGAARSLRHPQPFIEPREGRAERERPETLEGLAEWRRASRL